MGEHFHRLSVEEALLDFKAVDQGIITLAVKTKAKLGARPSNTDYHFCPPDPVRRVFCE